MRHDKLREWAHDTSRPDDPVVPHQVRADTFQTPSQKQEPAFFGPDKREAVDDQAEEYDYDAGESDYMEEEQAYDEQQPDYDETEMKARQMGWVPKEQWKGNPDDWTSAKRFVQTGEMIQANRALHQKVEHLQTDFEQRLNNVKMLHEAQLKNTIDRLKAERDQAVEMADTDKYRALNEQIENLQNQGVQNGFPTPQATFQQQSDNAFAQNGQQNAPINGTTPAQSPADLGQVMTNIANTPAVQSWRQKNSWIEQDTPKTAYAERQFVQWVQQNINNPSATIEQGLQYVDAAVAREFPNNINYNQQRPSMAERGRGRIKRGGQLTLSMSDLTREERQIWQTMGKSFKNQADFLRAVQDNREAERNG